MKLHERTHSGRSPPTFRAEMYGIKSVEVDKKNLTDNCHLTLMKTLKLQWRKFVA